MITSYSETTPRTMALVISTSVVGTAVEWYDIFLYGTVATLVFPHYFFPNTSPFIGTLLALTTFLVGFIARPIGTVLFGHFGDRVGRKSALIITLLCTGLGTFAIGLLPGYCHGWSSRSSPRIATAFSSGISVGGEWGGSVLMTIEYSDDRRRGYWVGWPPVGLPMGLVLSSIAVAVMQQVTGDQFVTWGWRIPFLLSALLIAIGLFIRIRIMETPVFRQMQHEQNISRVPLAEALTRNWSQIFASMGVKFIEQAPLYLFQTFIIVYAGTYLHVDKQLLIIGIGTGVCLEMYTIPIFSYLSDLVGHRRCYLIATLLMAGYAFPYFLLLSSGDTLLILSGIIASFAIFHAALWGPEAALIAEQFRTRYRYSGTSVGSQIAAPLSGGLVPIISVTLLQTYHGSFVPIALLLIGIALISALCLFGMKRGEQLSIAQ